MRAAACALAALLLPLAGCSGETAGEPAHVRVMVFAHDLDGDGREDLTYQVSSRDAQHNGVRIDGSVTFTVRRPAGHSPCVEGEPAEPVLTREVALRAGDGVARKDVGVGPGGVRREASVVEYAGLVADAGELALDGQYDVEAEVRLGGGLRFQDAGMATIFNGNPPAWERPLDATRTVAALLVQYHPYGSPSGSAPSLEVTGTDEGRYRHGCAFDGVFRGTFYPIEDGSPAPAAAAEVEVALSWSGFTAQSTPSVLVPLPAGLAKGEYRVETVAELADGRSLPYVLDLITVF